MKSNKTLNQVSNFIKQAEVDLKSGKQTKFLYAVKRTLDLITKEKLFKKYDDKVLETNQTIADIQTKYQSTDDDGNLRYKDEKSSVREFTPENEKICRKEIFNITMAWKKTSEKILEDEIHTFDCHECHPDNIPTNLTFEQIDAYRGFVIPEDYEPSFEDE